MPACLHAQVTGTISGYVLDPSGAAIPGVEVTATSEGQQMSRTAVSNAQGFYDFPAIPPGTYSVSAESPGFQKMTLTGITVSIDQNVRADLKLKLGQAAEAVTVTAETTLVESRSATVSALVDDRRVVDLPLNGRNVMALAATLPGVTNVSAPQQLSDARSGPTMNVNGGFFNNPSRNTGMNYPPPDALQEFRIVTQNFSAEHGRNAGSQVNVVSKSGTNDFHGSAWEFLRNDKLNARNFFANRVPSLKQNQFGVAVGGPIKRDKLFFFGSYQGLRERPEAVAAEATVPSE
ncbi:MAG: carboxypeptidase regulatory-like domain-containing protein, partial [Bryobacteraceae bacterium]|nr:carboxypeptidase regulatory-like domain-containing protein [Bryobacteraceae bacterium]